jgi:hypothetical protein
VSIESLQVNKKQLLKQLQDIFCPEKLEVMENIKEINQRIHAFQVAPYFCTQCNYFHHIGPAYLLHHGSGLIPFEWPPFIIPNIQDHQIKINLVGIYKLRTSGYVKQLSKNYKLFPKKNFSEIWDEKCLLGYVEKNDIPRIKKLERFGEINVYYERYVSSETNSSRKSRRIYAVLKVNVSHHHNTLKVINGIRDWAELGRQELGILFFRFDHQDWQLLENLANTPEYSILRPYMQLRDKKYNVKTKDNHTILL